MEKVWELDWQGRTTAIEEARDQGLIGPDEVVTSVRFVSFDGEPLMVEFKFAGEEPWVVSS